MACPLVLVTTNHNSCWFFKHRTNTPTYGSPTLKRFISNSSVLQTRRRHQSFFVDPIQCEFQRTGTRYVFISCCRSRDDHNLNLNNICCGWLRCFNNSWRLLSGTFFLCLFCFNLVGEAHGDEGFPFGYACEDASSYYAPVEHMEGEALMKKLNSIMSNHRSLAYKEVWDALKILDAADVDNPEASSDVVEIYSLRVVPKLLAGKPEGWNREHLWPRSYGLTTGPSLTDLHNIRPADVNVNSSRGNKYYGECLPTSSQCLKPANKEAAFDTETDNKRWAPPLQVRGDIARALMYMAISYGFNQSDGSPNLHLSDSPSIKNKEMGILSTLLKWNELDPPSRAEQLRNHRVCSLYQHNRNPFVDHPEYANLIWKQAIPSHQTLGSHSLNAWINEFHYNNKGKDHNEFVEIVVGPLANADELKVVLYNGANGKMYRFLPLADDEIFHVTSDGSGFLIYTASVPLQNGPADGIALVSDGKDHLFQVIQFISYEGVVKATNGPAVGTESVDIGLEETEGSSEFDSLGVTGMQADKLKWRKFVTEASPMKLNIGQILSNS